MLKKIFLLLALLLFSLSAKAQLNYNESYNPEQNLQEYFQEANPNYNKSIIYVFYNDNPCETCPQAMEMIEQVYNQNYQGIYNLILINYQDDQEYNFIETYNLSKSLEVVLVKVDDGATFGYNKVEGLQNMVFDPTGFNEFLQNRINTFLGNQ